MAKTKIEKIASIDEEIRIPSRPRPASPLPFRRAPVCAVLLRCLGGFGGG